MTNQNHTYASHGEDSICVAVLERLGIKHGSYLEVGAYHPSIASNSALLNELGWNGALVEPNPFMANLLREARPGDAVFEFACGNNGEATLHMFSDWASSNSMDEDFAAKISSGQGIEVARTIKVKVKTVSEVIRLMELQGFDKPEVVSIDVEGMDFEVLSTFDFDYWKPTIFVIEDIDLDLSNVAGSSIYRFMIRNGYRMISHALISSIYVRDIPENKLF
jgi:FkbM family methyltransferase